MKIKYQPYISGYLTIFREIQNLLQNERINFSIIGVYVCFVFQADWDRRHKYCRAILADDKDLALLWNCDISTISRNKKRLLELGLLELIGGIYYIKNLSLFEINTVKAILKKKATNIHSYYLKTEKDLAESLFEIENMQET